jgi:hypothetical protein
MLFKRYASPMVLLDQMIRGQRLHEFVCEFVNIHNTELEDQTKWEFWLHKVFDQTFKEFLEGTSNDQSQTTRPSDEDLETTVKESMEILNGFCLS